MISIPFSGSKRYWVKRIEGLAEKRGGYKTVLEVFGGSAILSANLLNDGLAEEAIVNDFDHLFDIYPEFLDVKDKLIADLEAQGFEKSQKKLPPDKLKYLQDKIREIDPKFWKLLATNFCFSGKSCDFDMKPNDFTYFHNDTTTTKQRAYLEIVKRFDLHHEDWRDLLEECRPLIGEDCLLILDPPYLNSTQKQYEAGKFFGLSETIALLNYMKEVGCDFILFNMREDDTRALLDLYKFRDYFLETRHTTIAAGADRQDVMVYVKQS